MAISGGWAWTQRDTLVAWYCVRQLARSNESDRDRLAERVAERGEAAVPELLDKLSAGDEAVCANVRAALDKIGARWGAADARTAALLRQVGEKWPSLSAAGRRVVLEAAAGWLRTLQQDQKPEPGVVPAVADLLAAAAKGDADVQAAGLALCDCLMTLAGSAAARGPACELVRTCLKADSAEVRLRAIRASLRPGMDLSEQVALLLDDPAVAVRRAAVAAVGPPDPAVPDDTLLPCLHDSDPEVRRLCEEALRDLRGVKPVHLKLGRMLSHPDFMVRLELLEEIREFQRLELERNVTIPIDPGVWMVRLSHDPKPSVRAAAAWVMTQQPREDCSRRLAEMARDDPSPTVCYLAAYYLRRASSAAPGQ
jgi:HEAT repeat protein